VKDAAARKREKYENFLKSVPLLSSMDHYERSKLSDAIKEQVFEPEDFIIKEVSKDIETYHITTKSIK
jgi:cAMP-dependent protein kinase regulator